MNGMRSFVPSSFVDVSTVCTSRNTRGRNASPSIASRLRASDISVSEPPRI
jgi:hypothetical protein